MWWCERCLSGYRPFSHHLINNKSTLDNSPPQLLNLEGIIAATGSNYWRKMEKIAINRRFFQPLLNLSENYLSVTCITNLKKIHEFFQVIAPTRSNYWRKRRKIAISRPFWIFFQPLLKSSENWSLATCITNLGRIHFKLSCPQVNVNADPAANTDDAELQLQ